MNYGDKREQLNELREDFLGGGAELPSGDEPVAEPDGDFDSECFDCNMKLQHLEVFLVKTRELAEHPDLHALPQSRGYGCAAATMHVLQYWQTCTAGF